VKYAEHQVQYILILGLHHLLPSIQRATEEIS